MEISDRRLPELLTNLTPVQEKYLIDNHRFVITPAGRRSRKTLIGRRKVLIAALASNDHRYFHGAPTRQQAKAIFWDKLKRDAFYFTDKKSETELMVKLKNGTEIHVVGLDKPERIEGQLWHGCHITEIGKVKAGAWEENIRPCLADTGGFAILDGVPEGRNHYYELALKACGGALPLTKPKLGAVGYSDEDPDWAYYSWFSADVLKATEMAANKRQMDEKTYRQEYEGSFESYEGLAYYTFGQHNLANVQRNINYPVCIGMDFNVNPMTATLGHVIGDQYLQFGEIYLNNSNTFEMRDKILEKYKPHEVRVYPDSTGKAEHSNASASDIDILEKAGFKIYANLTNPFVHDRVNTVNSFVKDRSVFTRYKVNPETCPKTINDFNKDERTSDGRLNKDQEKIGLQHILSALGYLICFNFPLKTAEITQTPRN